jgi:2-(1,2-epoxy-1,2-dihydrophenyl)acetyl-CoA isomerase
MTLVRLQREGTVLHLTLDRPEARNSIDVAGARSLLDAAQRCATADGIGAILIDAAGPFFCPGGDLRELGRDVAELPARLLEVTSYLHAAIAVLRSIDTPIVAAVGGTVAGAGIGLACTADIVLAAESARFVFAYSAVGLSPDAGVSYYLPRLVGLRAALEIALANRPLAAGEAVELGLATRVVSDDQLGAETQRCLNVLLEQSPVALRATKRAVYRGADAALEEQLAFEAATLARVATTQEARDRVAAFAARSR